MTPDNRTWFISESGTLREVFVGPAAIVVKLRVESPDFNSREEIASVLRTVREAATQVGRAAPVVGILQTSTSPAEEVRRWSRDQSWHLGDFSLEVPTTEQAFQTTWERWVQLAQGEVGGLLGPSVTKVMNPDEQLARRLEELRTHEDSEALGSLHEAAAALLRGDDTAIDRWVDGQLSEATAGARE